MHSIASIVELLSEANVLCDKPIPQEYFINEEFNRCILPEFEFKLYMKNMFSYLKTPSILSFGFKGLMLKHYSRTMNKKAITIRRSNIVEDAIEHVLKLPKEELQKHMTIQFDGENAQDSGGVSREFFLLFVNEFFSEEYKLFNEIESGLFWFISQKHSQQKNGNLKERLINFKYVGILVGLALSNSIILPIRFPLFLYKKLYNMQLSFKDYENFDPEAADGLRKLKNIKTEEEMDMACLYFTAISSDKSHEIPIVPGGLDKQVTLENVDEYIEKKIHFHMSEEIKDEFNMFQEGFLMSEPQILKTFKFFDMDTLISGTQVLDWPALKSKASYVNGLNENSPSVVMFWKIFFEMDDKKKALMLQFITGCARAPPGGLEAVSLVISRSSDVDKLPTAHTCSSTLVLPDYRNEVTMKRALDICTGNAEGFGLI
ncbi:hypothetical protein TRFO_39511 [Tritrichomonas foetus]|uniref:HECT-type E3 ubiquitin transferase n=1 Tax=Tritrichomonas foetus TaxID=1144522 RepID=A0A1J4J7T0_9EUKA|nr:hypothetical protein TRFO_39511 [Tritrichomonas foetus]|eukprot:OHS94287.1 hypothetical protein TRFO_39511 [Tritrichomonas foetus]